MPRSPAAEDLFTAVAEPRRRRILELLAEGERPVNDVVKAIRIPQPQVSKHLRILKEVGLVEVRQDGRRRLYRVVGERLKPVHDWASTFEHFWDGQLTRIKDRAEKKHRKQSK